MRGLRIIVPWCVCLLGAYIHPYAQCPSHDQINAQIELSENDAKHDKKERLLNLYLLKTRFESCNLLKDSIYAKILHKIGILEYQDNNSNATENSFRFTAQAIQINTSGIKRASPAYATKSFYNLGIIHKNVGFNKEAIRFYDSTIQYAIRYPAYRSFLRQAREQKVQALFENGDYQAAVDEATLGISDAFAAADSLMATRLYNKRAESFLLKGDNQKAIKDALINIVRLERLLSKRVTRLVLDQVVLNEYYRELANAYKIKALSIDGKTASGEQQKLMTLSNSYQTKMTEGSTLFNNYNDFGAYYLNTAKDYKKAKQNYLQSLRYAKDSKSELAFAYLNLGATAFPAGNYLEASNYYLRFLSQIGLPAKTILDNRPVVQWMAVPFKQLVHVFLNNKTELLLNLYKRTNEDRYLQACLETAAIADSVIQETRWQQSAEQSKLVWRNKTRNFYSYAIEACFLAKNYRLGFYYMEKSRAVILADRLNEQGASAQLPINERVREQLLRRTVAKAEQSLNELSPSALQYDSINTKLIEAQYALQSHIVSLEKSYPAYYHDKFPGVVLTFDKFTAYLKNTQRSFVSYFLSDTASYILALSGDMANISNMKMMRVPSSAYNRNQLAALLTFFADGSLQNRYYDSLVRQSHKFFKEMFEPLAIRKGHVILCLDGFILPFEALCKDQIGSRNLLEDYTFSYVYSANSIFAPVKTSEATNNFAGFAPVSFKPNLHLASLDFSSSYLDEVASNYTGTKLFAGKRASRNNFLSNLGGYRIVNVFSHATAGDDENEPMLYMEDSVIRLSELQYLDNINTRLVVLSACQTSAGKYAMGEGIYSLSRGFAAAGIPAVMATIWRADEKTVYQVSILFHKHLAAGMRKDDALRLAKIEFLKEADEEQRLPYYWSNMIIMGNTDTIAIDYELPWTRVALIFLGFGIIFVAWKYGMVGKRIGTFLLRNKHQHL